jgi:hypothetical protein
LIAVNDCGVVVKDAFTFAFQVLELAAMQRPGEDADDKQHENGRDRNQQVQDLHRWPVQRPARSALRTTSSELPAIPNPAAQGGSQPASASGMQAAL